MAIPSDSLLLPAYCYLPIAVGMTFCICGHFESMNVANFSKRIHHINRGKYSDLVYDLHPEGHCTVGFGLLNTVLAPPVWLVQPWMFRI